MSLASDLRAVDRLLTGSDQRTAEPRMLEDLADGLPVTLSDDRTRIEFDEERGRIALGVGVAEPARARWLAVIGSIEGRLAIGRLEAGLRRFIAGVPPAAALIRQGFASMPI